MPKLNQYRPAASAQNIQKLSDTELSKALELLMDETNSFFEHTSYQILFGQVPAIQGSKAHVTFNDLSQSWIIYLNASLSKRQRSHIMGEVIKLAFPHEDPITTTTEAVEAGVSVLHNVPTNILCHPALYKKLGIRKKRVNKTRPVQQCIICFTRYVPSTYNQKYCSATCRRKDQDITLPKPHMINKHKKMEATSWWSPATAIGSSP